MQFVARCGAAFLVSLAAAIPGCEAQVEPEPFVCTVTAPTACTAPELVWADVQPIFESRCNGCHTSRPGDPWPLDTYSHVADWWDVVRDELASCNMPPQDSDEEPLLPEQRDTILMWLRCGFPEE